MQDAIVFMVAGSDGKPCKACIDRSEVIAFETIDLVDGTIHQLRVISRYGRQMDFRFAGVAQRNAVARALVPDVFEEIKQ